MIIRAFGVATSSSNAKSGGFSGIGTKRAPVIGADAE